MTTMPPDGPAERLAKVVDDLSAYLGHLQEEGTRRVAMDPAVLEPLGAPVAGPPPATASSPAEPSTTGGGAEALGALAEQVAACTICPLHATRMNPVPGQGASNPELIFIGEGPGADEDAQGLAFVGRSGKLLTRLINAMGLTREEVWIGNIVKCRPPGNRAPHPDEMDACMPYLKAQLAVLKPKVIVCLGATAVKGLLDTKKGITRLRGTWMSFEGVDVMPTFHPSYLLRGGGEGKARYWEVWEDMCSVLERLGRPVPARKK